MNIGVHVSFWISVWFFQLYTQTWNCWVIRQWQPTSELLPGKSHGWKSLEGCKPWGRWGSDTTEWLHFHFSLSCIGEGNGNPLQCSCLENPRDGGAWWAAIYGVTQSRTQLKCLSSSSGSMALLFLVFWETSTLFSTVTILVYISINNVKGFSFLHILPNICYLWSFWWWPFWQVWGDTSLRLWCAFSWWGMMF